MPAVVVGRPKSSEAMMDALKKHIIRERHKKKQEQEADAEEERQRQERERQQKQDVMTLGETREQISQLEHRLAQLKDEKHQLFLLLKKVLNEDDNRRRQLVKESNDHLMMHGYPAVATLAGHPQIFLQQNMPLVGGRAPIYKVGAPTHGTQHTLLPPGTLKRSRSPSPPPSNYAQGYGFKTGSVPTYPQQKVEDSRTRGHDYVRAVLWNKNTSPYGGSQPFYPQHNTIQPVTNPSTVSYTPTPPQTVYTYSATQYTQPPSGVAAVPPPREEVGKPQPHTVYMGQRPTPHGQGVIDSGIDTQQVNRFRTGVSESLLERYERKVDPSFKEVAQESCLDMANRERQSHLTHHSLPACGSLDNEPSPAIHRPYTPTVIVQRDTRPASVLYPGLLSTCPSKPLPINQCSTPIGTRTARTPRPPPTEQLEISYLQTLPHETEIPCQVRGTIIETQTFRPATSYHVPIGQHDPANICLTKTQDCLPHLTEATNHSSGQTGTSITITHSPTTTHLEITPRKQKLFPIFVKNAAKIAPCASTQSNEALNSARVSASMGQAIVGSKCVTLVTEKLGQFPGKQLQGTSYKFDVGMLLPYPVVTEVFHEQSMYVDGSKIDQFKIGYFDVETTGMSMSCSVIQIALNVGDGFYSCYILPEYIPDAVSEITGFTIDRGCLLLNGVQVDTVSQGDAWVGLVNFLKNVDAPVILAGHNVAFDLRYTLKEITECNLLTDFIKVVYGTTDTVKLIKRALPGLENYKQTTVAAKLSIFDEAGAHNALGDIRILKQITVKLGISLHELRSNCVSLFNQMDKKRKVVETKQNVESLQALQGSITTTMIRKMATAGINMQDLKNVMRQGGKEGLEIFMTGNCNNRPRVTKNKDVIAALGRFLEKE